MKRSLTQLLGGCAVLLAAMTSCNKDEVRAVTQPGAAPVLTASVASSTATPITLLQTQKDNKAITYTWTPTTFGYQAIIGYALQFDKKGGDFSSPITFGAGSALTQTLTVADLNSVYQAKGLVSATTTPTPTPVDVRVVASVADGVMVASAVSAVTATPYAFCEQPAASKAWTIIGPAGKDWNTDIPLQYDCATKTYTYTGPLKADAFKFRYGGQWKDDLNLGGNWSSTGGTLIQNSSDNLNVPAAGNYTIVLTPGSIDASNKITGASFTVK